MFSHLVYTYIHTYIHIHSFIQAGADIGLLVSGNLTALHICAENGLTAAVQSIVETDTGRKCCQIETVDGNRPIHLAGEYIVIICMYYVRIYILAPL